MIEVSAVRVTNPVLKEPATWNIDSGLLVPIPTLVLSPSTTILLPSILKSSPAFFPRVISIALS